MAVIEKAIEILLYVLCGLPHVSMHDQVAGGSHHQFVYEQVFVLGGGQKVVVLSFSS